MQSVVDNVFSWKKAELYICKRCGCEYGIDSADTIHFCELCGSPLCLMGDTLQAAKERGIFHTQVWETAARRGDKVEDKGLIPMGHTGGGV